MFFNEIKDFWTKKIVNKRVLNVKHLPSNNSIKNIGIVFDESYFLEKDLVIEELVQKGFHKNNISMLVFKDNIKKTETFTYPVFSYHDLSWIATFLFPLPVQKTNQFTYIYFDTIKRIQLSLSLLCVSSFSIHLFVIIAIDITQTENLS
jgi:hypothetical protein